MTPETPGIPNQGSSSSTNQRSSSQFTSPDRNQPLTAGAVQVEDNAVPRPPIPRHATDPDRPRITAAAATGILPTTMEAMAAAATMTTEPAAEATMTPEIIENHIIHDPIRVVIITKATEEVVEEVAEEVATTMMAAAVQPAHNPKTIWHIPCVASSHHLHATLAYKSEQHP